MNAKERQFYNEFFKTIGIDPSSFKTPTAKQSPYFDAQGKRIPQKRINQYEIVYDSKGKELPNPQGRGLIDLMPANPRDLIAETVGASIGEAVNNPEVGAVGGLLASILTGKPKSKQQVSNFYISNPYQYKNYPVAVKDRAVAKNMDSRVGKIPLEGLPRLNQSTSLIRGLDADEVDWILSDKYGKDAVPIFREGQWSNFGNIRGKENIENITPFDQPVMFGNIKAQMSDVDVYNAEHFDKYVTARNQGEAWDQAQKYVRDNPERQLSVDLTPGGMRFYDTSQAGTIDKMGGDVINNYMKYMGGLNTDPAYMNFELSRLAETVNNIYRTAPNKIKQNKALLDFVTQRPYRMGKDGPVFPRENWRKIKKMGDNPVRDLIDWNKITSMPKYIKDEFSEGGGLMSAIRLSAKPSRIRKWAQKRSESPFTSQWIGDIVGKESLPALHPKTAVADKDRIVDQLRYVQGLQDPVRKDWGVGFGDSNILDPLISSFDNKTQEMIRKNLKLGLLPAIPTLNQEFNIEENR